jgi:hypothetical protein
MWYPFLNIILNCNILGAYVDSDSSAFIVQYDIWFAVQWLTRVVADLWPRMAVDDPRPLYVKSAALE